MDTYNTTLKILYDLVAFDTTSRNSNLGIIDYIEGYLAKHRARCERVYNPDNTKANLIAAIGPDVPGGILLSGHTDVVPVDGQNWTSDPFTLTERDGRFYGRGSTDMKGFLACVLSQVPAWATAELAKPVYMVFSYDEEIGCRGVIPAIEVLKKRGINPDLCIIGEPTEMHVAQAHNSRADINITARATGGHASKVNTPEITCANTVAMLVCNDLYLRREEIGRLLGSELIGPASLAITAWNTPATHNVVAAETKIHIDFRGKPNVDEAVLRQTVQDSIDRVVATYVDAKTGLVGVELDVAVTNPGFHCTDEAAVGRAMQLAAVNGVEVVPYVCEAARFADAGLTSIICGPGILEAHQPDEYIEAEQLRRGIALMERVTRQVVVSAPG